MRDYRFFVYMLNSSSRRALYTGMTNFLIKRVNEHRSQQDNRHFTAHYRAYRLVYYEEFAA
jgi:putative endonuclease